MQVAYANLAKLMLSFVFCNYFASLMNFSNANIGIKVVTFRTTLYLHVFCTCSLYLSLLTLTFTFSNNVVAGFLVCRMIQSCVKCSESFDSDFHVKNFVKRSLHSKGCNSY